jgi:hypothetical protein
LRVYVSPENLHILHIGYVLQDIVGFCCCCADNGPETKVFAAPDDMLDYLAVSNWQQAFVGQSSGCRANGNEYRNGHDGLNGCFC